eukprot:CAMPEP_0117030776 /NCGR_PEP_ID=MMETSP0472-20121206/22190_1 /TAXON_ID=693140 ORGANISM="Tiarina fusus, Strain LIS" /NCGR_SAMPLE_ID=MMETSP0472 /ASSEMBLY_ACC=CAM_ASM_000603 /LENGTH=358 /DNA_ID=CAMNT_0004738951 /DNA_START=83 /DNA_END=1159 /DNA_ORIENTATION=-
MNNQTFNPALANQDRRFFNDNGGGGQDQLGNSNSNGNSGTPVTAFLRGGAQAPGMMNFGNNGNSMGNSNQMAAMMNQMGQMQNMNQNPQMQMNAMNNLNLNDLKRLQQLQQQLQNNTPSNPLLVPQAQQQQQQDPSAAILQSYLDQKIQSTRFDDSLRTSLGMGGLSGMGGQNPMLGSNLLQERLMMNQNSMGQQGGNAGELPLPSPHSLFHRDGSRRMRGGVIEPFPEKLHRLLLEVEAAGRSDVISFVANGRAFAIHKPDKFFKEIVPLYFRQSRLSSFKRQLNLYGFELINTGPARGGYYHELFVKDRAELCRRMRRVAVKVNPKEGSEAKESGDSADKSKTKEESASNNQVAAS